MYRTFSEKSGNVLFARFYKLLKLKELLNKAYDFMKQFVVEGRNLLERFLESIGQVVEKVRCGFIR